MKGIYALCMALETQNRNLNIGVWDPIKLVEITPQVVTIATLDGVVMEDYINRSKLKRFYGPLTLQTLQTIHSNQRRKKEKKLAQLQARQEAKEREVREKSKRMTLSKGTLKDGDLGDEEL